MARRQNFKAIDRHLAPSYAKPALALLQDATLLRNQGGSSYAVEQLAINASIRASDAICIALRGEHSQGNDHRQAVALLKTVAPDLASKLELILAKKSSDLYDIKPPSAADLMRIMRAATALVDRALEVSGLN